MSCTKTIEKLTGVKRIKFVTSSPVSFFLKPDEILSHVVVTTPSSEDFYAGTTANGTDLMNEVINGNITYTLDYHNEAGKRIYFSGYTGALVTIKLLIFKI